MDEFGSVAEIDAWLRTQGFFEGGAEGLVARRLPRLRALRFATPDGDAGPAGAVSAAAGRSRGPPRGRLSCARGRVPHRRLGAELDRRGVRGSGRGGSGRDRGRRRLPGQSRAAPVRALRGRPGRPRGCARAAPPARAAAARRRRLGDRLRLARALPRPARATRVDAADQGNAPAGLGRRPCRLREGRGRERDDRRPRAQRPLARVRARQCALARADGGASARRRRPPRLDGRGSFAARTSASQS